MENLREKIQGIRNKISQLLSQLKKNICVVNLSSIPIQINKIIIGKNKLSSLVNGSIEEITDIDMQGMTTVGDATFYECVNLRDINIPNGITTIGRSAICRCLKLTSIIIPSSVVTIGHSAFYNCIKLKNIAIPDSVTTIGNGAFAHCDNLQNVTIGHNVANIEYGVFQGCYTLSNIYLNPITPPSLGSTNAIPSTTTIHVPIGSGAAYKTATNWSYHSDRIVEDIVI